MAIFHLSSKVVELRAPQKTALVSYIFSLRYIDVSALPICLVVEKLEMKLEEWKF